MSMRHHGTDQRDHAAITLPDHALIPDHCNVLECGDVPDHNDDPERGGGAISVPMSLMLLAVILIGGLALDGVRALQGGARADRIAEEAARTAGQQLDLATVRQGRPALNPAAAITAGTAYLEAAGVEGSVTLAGPQAVHVEVQVPQNTVLLSLIQIPTFTSTGEADAQVFAVTPGDTP